ncbi:MAG TPA: GAF domain-containing protein, partial [Aggregatilineales bacterium]|nr:GAF domain-containing protein [Aggregatilineales bacterium]
MPTEGDELRKRAENILKERRIDPSQVSPDIKMLLHELDVHQVELQMQNEELRRAQEETEAARDRYADLYDFAPVGYVTLSPKGLITQANLTFAAMLGVDRMKLEAQRLSRYIVGGDSDPYYYHLKTLQETRQPQQVELRLAKRPDPGTPANFSYFWARIRSVPVLDDAGEIADYRMAVEAITEAKLAQESLDKARAQLQLLLDQRTEELEILLKASAQLTSLAQPDELLNASARTIVESFQNVEAAAIWLFDAAKNVLVVRAATSYGDARDNIGDTMPVAQSVAGRVYHTGKSFNVGDTRKDRAARMGASPILARARSALGVPLLAGGKALGTLVAYNFSRTEAFTDDDRRVMESLGVQIGLALQNIDLFDQIISSRAKIRQLAHRALNIQEDERRRVSHELHDEAAQALSILKLDLQNVRHGLNGGTATDLAEVQALREQMDAAIALADGTIARVRTLAFDLRPPSLDTLDFQEALHDYCMNFAGRTGIRVSYRSVEAPSVSDAIKITLYRFLQEALTNAVKHSQATILKVTLRHEDDSLLLAVKDNGRGFEFSLDGTDGGLRSALQHQQGLGLLGIWERHP